MAFHLDRRVTHDARLFGGLAADEADGDKGEQAGNEGAKWSEQLATLFAEVGLFLRVEAALGAEPEGLVAGGQRERTCPAMNSFHVWEFGCCWIRNRTGRAWASQGTALVSSASTGDPGESCMRPGRRKSIGETDLLALMPLQPVANVAISARASA